ncbi:LemA family protein [Roseomonas sp. NAR14]|uniref:LemA family protein n=1 Tax=Roseomonas acroporae TaxID=2937791 RepID=A0A9X1Y916_9PROT|nr:LemA family protein [Roseomonas acroporae]
MKWVILGILALLVLWLVVVYNRLVSLRQTTGQAWSDVDVQLKQRHDLIPNLVETVKGYASHERGTLDAVVRARNAAVVAQGSVGPGEGPGGSPAGDQGVGRGPEAAAAAEQQLGGALRQLFALSERYPDLKANRNFLQLQAELGDIENRIAAARRFFNNAVAEYNAATEQFPAVLFAGALGFRHRGFFELPEAERTAVQAAPVVTF